MTVATATKPATPRKRRARKVTVKAVKVAAPKITTPKRPSAAKLISPQRYVQDIQTRWAIHSFEIQELVRDLRKGFDVVTPYHAQLVKQVKAWTV